MIHRVSSSALGMTTGLHDPRPHLFTVSSPPCPFDWESNPDIDTCCHWWRVAVVAHWERADRTVYCERCRAPRCIAGGENDPCMERRHHPGVHVYLSGRFAPVGGRLT